MDTSSGATRGAANVHINSYHQDLLTRLQAARLQVSLAELDLQSIQSTLDAARMVERSLSDALRKFESEGAVISDRLDEEDTTEGKGKSKARR